MTTPQTLPRPQHPAPVAPATRERRLFPGWRWVAVALGFPIAGYIGWIVGGRVDAVAASLVGGALTGAGIGAVQWWAADGVLGRPAAWIAASALGFAFDGHAWAGFGPGAKTPTQSGASGTAAICGLARARGTRS